MIRSMSILLAFALPAAAAAQHAHGGDAASRMEAAREELRHHMGGQTLTMIAGERLEYVPGLEDGLLLWDGYAWYGGDIHKAWLETEGEYLAGDGELAEAELQLLYSRALSPWFDLQVGYRYDHDPEPSRHFAVLGVQGLAPYWFEIDAAAFLDEDGKLSARFEAEYEVFLTQRLILQPRLEIGLAASGVPELGIGPGITGLDAGLRLRYEVRREFAPYVGIGWRRTFGDTADLARAAGEETASLEFLAGLRFWY